MKKYSSDNFINRELSWLDFNNRVLDESIDSSNPLLERLKFVSITASNLDEFLMVRVGSLIDQINGDYVTPDFAGLSPKSQLKAILDKVNILVDKQYKIWDGLIDELKENNICFLKHHEELSADEINYVNNYFDSNVYPVLTPMAVDASRPFPLINSGALNLGALVSNSSSTIIDKNDDDSNTNNLNDKNNESNGYEFVTVEIPKVLPRVVVLPRLNDSEEIRLILLEEIIELNISKLFEKYKIICVHPYRITRNADLNINEDDASDLLKEVETQVRKRKWGEAVRLEVERQIDSNLLEFLNSKFDCAKNQICEIPGAIDLTFLNEIYKLKGFGHLKDKPYNPQINPSIKFDDDMFKIIKKKDVLLSHPYESFDVVTKLITNASVDDKVLAIKQTLYRVSGDSPIVKALENAALNGKQVTVLLELKARFDEEHNIAWAKSLERAGAHVIYGLKGLKTHSKITLIVRREKDGIRRYVHLSTGNYNDQTAKLYTDLGLITSDKGIGEDATALFNMMSGYSEPAHWNGLVVAPLNLRTKLSAMIRREIENANAGRKAKIVMKMNSLCDKKMIEELYDASKAGVKIKLIVRGICCLKPAVKDISENIKVISIVGRFLEHSRIYYFYNEGKEDLFLASADLMPRNLNRRVELMFPIYDAKIKSELMHHLDVLLNDNVKARIMNNDGTYSYIRNDKTKINAQEIFMKEAVKNAPKIKKISSKGAFKPLT